MVQKLAQVAAFDRLPPTQADSPGSVQPRLGDEHHRRTHGGSGEHATWAVIEPLSAIATPLAVIAQVPYKVLPPRKAGRRASTTSRTIPPPKTLSSSRSPGS